MEDNKQLLHLSAYIHKNPKEIQEVNNNKELINYFWSSYQDYAVENRWFDFLKPDIVLGQFKNKAEYINFVKTSPAKEKER